MLDLNWMLLALSGVVLASYLFDLIAHVVRLPSVVMLIASGIGIRLAMDLAGWRIDMVDVLLPVLGTLGLVLIVLDGALELRLTRQARGLMARASLSAILGIGVTGYILAAALHHFMQMDWLRAWVAATPFAVISSAVAIPAAFALASRDREHVVYESALSDIFGVLLFYALLDAEQGVSAVVLNIVSGVGLSSLIGALLGLLMVGLIGRIEAHVRFVPMIFGLVAAYAGSKLWHLAPLVTVLAVGLILNNIDQVRHLPKLRTLIPDRLDQDVSAFKHLTAELTFVVRTFFFVLLGYSTSIKELALPAAWSTASFILVVAFLCRVVLLKALMPGSSTRPLLWFAPRGLITVLLVISTPNDLRIAGFPDGALMLTVLGSIVIMSLGTIMDRSSSHDTEQSADDVTRQD
ncbi:MAG: hypothetical protein KGI91_03070 [Burkholderiales bacterium]|nr:hypothetical protein [Burkholderiales bacterium]MDE2076043.1 hypothetical protein [Burkholderiales bacterium]MDE2431422.1 hypothetical protein [Burkholderiales bacterium]